MTITLTNFGSGEIQIIQDGGASTRLTHDQANRLVMAARMHTVSEFIEKLPSLIGEPALLQNISELFEGKGSTERWNLKEKFARLQTLVKGYAPKNPDAVIETLTL